MVNEWGNAGGRIPDGWSVVALVELLQTEKSISVGVMYPGKHCGDGIPLVKVGDVVNGLVIKAPDSKVSLKVDEEYKRTKLNGSELLITLVGNPGECVIVTQHMVGWNVARALAVLRLKDIDIREWLKLILQSGPSRHIISSRLNTTVQRTLNLKDIKELPVLLPPKKIRKELCNFYYVFDKKIQLNRQINQTLEQMAQALFKSWFVDFDPVIDNALAAGNPIPEPLIERAAVRQTARASEGFQSLPDDVRQLFPSEFEESELGWIPKGWGSGILNDIAEYGTKRTSINDLSLENYVSTENMLQEKKGVETASKLPTVSTVPQYNSGTILVSNIRPYFKKIWFARGDGGYSNDVLGVEAKFVGIESYVFNLLYQDTFFDYMMTTAKGSKMPRGDKKAIMNWGIVIPTIDLMKIYSDKVNAIYESAESRRHENKSLVFIRDTLLPKLISGELRLDSPEVEKAKDLVEAV